MVATTLDPSGRRVSLTDKRWLHIKARHPGMARQLPEIMRTVREPERQMRGRSDDEIWFFAERRGSLPWLQVVVHYEGGEGWIATAFPRESLPGR